ncbi:MAG TPA: hypothetical protein VNQ33_07080 [Acidimicrobiales bacterium]|nr:hypothetical protein [Acidimicrobiales bacterium]
MSTPTVDPAPVLAFGDVRRAGRRVLARLDQLLAGRWWLVIVVLLAAGVSLFCAFPTYSGYFPHGRDWLAIQHIADHPFDQTGLIPSDRPYNFTFRVLVPLVGGRLGLTPPGYLALQACGALALFAGTARIVHRITESRRLAALSAIAVGLTWAGATGFVEIRGNFDSIAIALLVWAMATRKVPLVVLFGFLATWTDERALPALAFVALYHHIVESRDIRWYTALREPRVLAALGAAVLHVISRLAATAVFDLHQPSDLGFMNIKAQMSNLPVGAWTGLEGMWLFVALGVVALWRVRERLLSLVYLGYVGIFALGAIAVVDVTRSASYLLPAGLAAMAIVARLCDRRLLHHTTYAAFALSAAWPLYYAGGAYTMYWNYPLPLVIVRKLAGVE